MHCSPFVDFTKGATPNKRQITKAGLHRLLHCIRTRHRQIERERERLSRINKPVPSDQNISRIKGTYWWDPDRDGANTNGLREIEGGRGKREREGKGWDIDFPEVTECFYLDH